MDTVEIDAQFLNEAELEEHVPIIQGKDPATGLESLFHYFFCVIPFSLGKP